MKLSYLEREEFCMLDKFMSEHLFGKSIEVYFGGDEKDEDAWQTGGQLADGVIVLENNW